LSLPTPVPGLVIRYSYLWHHEAAAGREEGTKDRPCAVTLAHHDMAGEIHLLVLPITHSQPSRRDEAVEIPLAVKQRLGLDEAPSWVICLEANRFIWPGPDLRFQPGANAESVAYGLLPPKFFAHIRNKFLDLDRQRATITVERT
jgi:hypothetical protein